MKRALFALTALTLLLAACGPQQLTGAETQMVETGVAAANGLLTSTRAAETPRISTKVPTPPAIGPTLPPLGTANAGVPVTGATAPASTATAVPSMPSTSTGIPAATSSAAPAIPITGSTATQPASSGACNHPLDMAAAGPKVNLTIKNSTQNPISFTMGLAGTNSLGQCGFLSWSRIAPRSDIKAVAPQTRLALGDPCYWVYAVLDNPRGQTIVSNGGFCLDGGKLWTINVKDTDIRLIKQ